MWFRLYLILDSNVFSLSQHLLLEYFIFTLCSSKSWNLNHQGTLRLFQGCQASKFTWSVVFYIQCKFKGVTFCMYTSSCFPETSILYLGYRKALGCFLASLSCAYLGFASHWALSHHGKLCTYLFLWSFDYILLWSKDFPHKIEMTENVNRFLDTHVPTKHFHMFYLIGSSATL